MSISSISHASDSIEAPQDPRRRSLLTALGTLPLSASLGMPLMRANASEAPRHSGGLDDSRSLFAIDGSYINGAYMHPISRATHEAMEFYLNARLMTARRDQVDMAADRERAMSAFARMIGADISELAWIPSTTVGENAIINGLGLPRTRQRVVTDAYHFDGSLYIYGELAKLGLDLEVVRPRGQVIALADMERAIKPGTRLVAVTLVSNLNGFQHDLKALCEIAHARGALVYADIIQAAGTVPIDVHDSGVDFCACSTYKWLMGDFGAGFMYVRKDSLHHLKRSQWGYRQERSFDFHVFPYDTPGTQVFNETAEDTTAGHFEVGTIANGSIAAVASSLGLLNRLGIDRIQAWRQPLLQRMQEKIPALGYRPMTAPDSTSPIVTFAYKNASQKLAAKLKAADVTITLYPNRFRISPSFYNTMDDIDRLIEALS